MPSNFPQVCILGLGLQEALLHELKYNPLSACFKDNVFRKISILLADWSDGS